MNEWEWRLLEDHPSVASLAREGGELRPGTRVRLRPRPGGDVMDLILAGKTAVIESIEQDYEGGFHVAVVLDDDPGRDLGFMRQPGHRFFYTPEEVERCGDDDVAPTAPDQPSGSPVDAETTVLIAGIGNIFLGDDGFGVEVAQRLLARDLPAGVRVVDYGIRGLDLAYALMDTPGATILIDACPRGEVPGTLFVIEPEIEMAGAEESSAVLDAHSMNPMLVIRMAKSLGGTPKRILLLGCEPATLGPDEGQLGLSECVAAAVDEAVALALRLAADIHEGNWPGDGRQTSA